MGNPAASLNPDITQGVWTEYNSPPWWTEVVISIIPKEGKDQQTVEATDLQAINTD